MITLALRSCLSPRIGAVPCRWQQRPQHARVDRALSAVTSVAVTLVPPIAYWKHRRAARTSRRGQTNTSMTWPNQSVICWA
jgi:hypothetical protein